MEPSGGLATWIMGEGEEGLGQPAVPDAYWLACVISTVTIYCTDGTLLTYAVLLRWHPTLPLASNFHKSFEKEGAESNNYEGI